VELLQGPHLNQFLYRWGAVPARLAHWSTEPWVLLTLVTSMFLHGGWVHLIGNMLYLWIFGDNVEDEMGHGRFLLFYLIAGVVSGTVQVLFTPGSPLPGIGASGAVAGVLGAYVLFYPGAAVLVGIPLFFWFEVISVPALFVLGLWFLSQFLNGLASLAAANAAFTGGVAWWAHVGGFVTGLLLGPRMRQPRPRYWIRRVYYQ
ncbi:MAG TPA: rhomboid family intramembrane serine protease, partial [Anaerolineae bacterium]|nr:rhomboid family intramembrane serine protease [Anaerolineae bacterium]